MSAIITPAASTDEERAHPVGTDNSAGLRPAPCLTSNDRQKQNLAARSLRMKAKNKTSRILYPVVVIAIGAVFIVTKKGSSGHGEPEIESPWVAVVGVLFCLLGIWGLIRTLQEIRKEEKKPIQSSETTRGTGP